MQRWPGDAELSTYGRERLRELAAEMEQLITDYRPVWLARNRPVGLEESVARFDKLFKLYRQEP